MKHKYDLDLHRCSVCGCTGLEMNQEPRLIACDYDILEEYRALVTEHFYSINALFDEPEEGTRTPADNAEGSIPWFPALAETMLRPGSLPYLTISGKPNDWWGNPAIMPRLFGDEPETVEVSDTAQRNIAQAFK